MWFEAEHVAEQAPHIKQRFADGTLSVSFINSAVLAVSRSITRGLDILKPQFFISSWLSIDKFE